MTYGEWYARYTSLYCKKLAPKTLEGRARLSALIGPQLDALQINAITPEDIQQALLYVEAAAGSRQAQLAYALLHAVFRRAYRSRLLSWSPVEAVDRPQHEAAPGRAISCDDWEQLLPAISEDVAFGLMAFAGLRRGEVLGLIRADIDLPGQLIHVRRQRVRVHGQLTTSTPKSSAGVRDVPILPELAPQLQAACRYCLPSAPIVRCSPETLARRWRRAQLEAGVSKPYRLHDLRHTYATRLVLAGCNLKVLQYMIGHSSFELTANTYTHVGAADAVTEYKRVAGLLH